MKFSTHTDLDVSLVRCSLLCLAIYALPEIIKSVRNDRHETANKMSCVQLN